MRTQLVIFGFIVLSFICADEKPLYAQTARIDLARELILKDGANPSFDHIILLLEEKNSFPDDTLKKYFHLLESVISKSASQTQQDQLEYFKVFLMHKENSFAYASAYCDSVIQKLKLEGRESVHLIKVLQIKASLLVRNGRYEEALTCYYDGLNIAVRLNNTEYNPNRAQVGVYFESLDNDNNNRVFYFQFNRNGNEDSRKFYFQPSRQMLSDQFPELSEQKRIDLKKDFMGILSFIYDIDKVTRVLELEVKFPYETREELNKMLNITGENNE